MNKLFRVGLTTAFVIASTALAFAAAECLARFSDAPCFEGVADLALTLSAGRAGGGAQNFTTDTFVRALSGPAFDAEVAKLEKRFGKEAMDTFYQTHDYAWKEGARLRREAGLKAPEAPNPSPSDRKALADALWNAGVYDKKGSFDVEHMLDKLMTHQVHLLIMDGIDKTYGRKADATYHIVLAALVADWHNQN